jgi:hypothetical protein
MLENKYTKYYNQIINSAKNRTLEGYCENHHIIPKSLGGNNLKENLVKLTAREHFVCHLLLTKMYSGEDKNKMIHAVWAMATLENLNQERYKINSRTYENLRIKYATLKSKTLKGKPGRAHSEETKRKISEAHTGKKRKPMSEEAKRKLSESMKGKNLGKQLSEERKQQISNSLKGRKRKPVSEETKEKLRAANLGKKKGPDSLETRLKKSLALKGKVRSEEHGEKISQALKGRKPSEVERKAYLEAMERGKTTCEYCGKTTTKGNYVRWHGSNCKKYK